MRISDWSSDVCSSDLYRPQFYFRTTDVTGTVELPEGTEMVMPADNVALGVKLIAPIAMDVGQRFTIREGGRTVSAGVVSGIDKQYRRASARFPGPLRPGESGGGRFSAYTHKSRASGPLVRIGRVIEDRKSTRLQTIP